jgi:hypothetical protein
MINNMLLVCKMTAKQLTLHRPCENRQYNCKNIAIAARKLLCMHAVCTVFSYKCWGFVEYTYAKGWQNNVSFQPMHCFPPGTSGVR